MIVYRLTSAKIYRFKLLNKLICEFINTVILLTLEIIKQYKSIKYLFFFTGII